MYEGRQFLFKISVCKDKKMNICFINIVELIKNIFRFQSGEPPFLDSQVHIDAVERF